MLIVGMVYIYIRFLNFKSKTVNLYYNCTYGDKNPLYFLLIKCHRPNFMKAKAQANNYMEAASGNASDHYS